MTTTPPTGIQTREQAACLANLLNQIRPDWPTSSLMTLLAEHRTHPATFGEICQAAITKAQEADLRTPAAIFNPGPHWPERAKATLPRTPCPQHREEDEHTCRCCAADRLAANTTNTGQSELAPPATCQDHPEHEAGTCPTCWAEVQTGTRRRNHIGRHNPQGHS
ncbi:hypothetical protein DWB68_10310 [Galactobacter valiniphilus]|uniref:Uncharacterized protein n=1 Tax=Galactobacter valiniphilus TaxID=2676122 RepID=A0A399JA10_9MICC|nr:hypothetical protein [Galactobacter valiniphilus]RII41910.1 hypothetical protein DWB68_10310 [Galactobacter valiniphilus]